MKHKFILFITLLTLFSSKVLKAQEILANSGDFFQSESFKLSWTVGEPVVETFYSENFGLTQGFQQLSTDLLYIKTISDEIKIDAYPNPVDGILYIRFENSQKTFIKAELIDIQGKQIKTVLLQSYITELDFELLTSGIYFLRIYGSNIYKTIKINKI